PRPGVPLQADAAERVGFEVAADEIQPRLPVSDARVGGQARPLLREGQLLLARKAIARAGELIELGARAQGVALLAGARDERPEIGEHEHVAVAERLAGEGAEAIERRAAAGSQVVRVLLPLQQ